MDLSELKNLVKSIVAASGGRCTVQRLLYDFEEETGFEMPSFNFFNARDFLFTLSDIIQVFKTRKIKGVEFVSLVSSKHDKHKQNPCDRGKYEYRCLDLSTRNPSLESDAERDDIDLFITAYQKGWIGVKDDSGIVEVLKGSFTKVNGYGEELNGLSFLLDHSETSDSILARRASLYKFLERIDPVPDTHKILATVFKCSSYDPFRNFRSEVIASMDNFMSEVNSPIPFQDFPELCAKVSVKLNYSKYGYRTLLEMVRSMKEVFRCVRKENGDWLLFNAKESPDSYESKMYLRSIRNISQETINLILYVVDNCKSKSLPHGIIKEDFISLFYKTHKKKLDYIKYGFPNISTMISEMNGKYFRIEDSISSCIIKPLIEKERLGNRSIFSITPEDDVFKDLFPENSVNFGEHLPELNRQEIFIPGSKIPINVCEFSSPPKFFIRLKAFEYQFQHLKRDMGLLYKYYEDSYRMPDSTILPTQVCAAFVDIPFLTKWNRAVITKVLYNDRVEVFLPDNGIKLILDKDKIRFLSRDFYYLPVQAFPAKLKGFNLSSTEITRKESSYFHKVVCHPNITFIVSNEHQTEQELIGDVFIKENNQYTSASLTIFKFLMESGRYPSAEFILTIQSTVQKITEMNTQEIRELQNQIQQDDEDDLYW